jgi:uncharacterized protein YjbJ (UPF0337 family)
MVDDSGGKAKHVGGKIQEKVGEALGDRRMEKKGRLSQIEGEAEQDQAHAEEEAEDAAVRKRIAREEKERS